MPRPQAFSTNEIEQIAVLLADPEMTQKRVAELLNVAPATITRATQKAIKEGFLVEKKLEITPKVSQESIAVMRMVLDVPPLEEKLKALEKNNQGTHHFQNFLVFDSGDPRKSHQESMSAFVNSITSYLSKQLLRKDVKVMGVSWGVALLTLLDSLRMVMPQHPRRNNPVTCIPIAGSPPDAELLNKISSGNLAGAFHRLLNGPGGELTFSVGGWIPKSISDRHVEVIRQYARSSPFYEKVFSKQGLIHELDCVLTSVGAINDFAGPWLQAAAKAAGLSVEQFSDLTIGNISGCFLPAPGLKSSRRKTLEHVNDRWLGIQLEQLKSCAKRAVEKKVPGVIIIGIGEGKAELIVESIKQGLVNIACCDIPLMRAINKRLKASSAVPE